MGVTKLKMEIKEFGYALYNAHQNKFVEIPPSDEIETRTHYGTQEQVVENEEQLKALLKELIKQHDLQNMKHLRVVKAEVDEEMDEKMAEMFDELRSAVNL